MRSIVTLSLLSIGIFSTPFNLIQAKPVEDFIPTSISKSEYSIIFTQKQKVKTDVAYDKNSLNESLVKANAFETEKYERFLEEQRIEAERRAREEEARQREEERQAKLAAERAAAQAQRRAEEAAKAAAVTNPAPVITGSKEDWMRQAGIPESDWWYVDFIVFKESSWNPSAVNKSSGACGLAQALPCSKIPGDWRDPVNSLRWQYQYVQNRYGGYKGAYEFWLINNWY